MNYYSYKRSECKYQMLKLWKQRNGSNATVDALVEILEKMR